jgi:hypothetical protein
VCVVVVGGAGHLSRRSLMIHGTSVAPVPGRVISPAAVPCGPRLETGPGPGPASQPALVLDGDAVPAMVVAGTPEEVVARSRGAKMRPRLIMAGSIGLMGLVKCETSLTLAGSDGSNAPWLLPVRSSCAEGRLSGLPRRTAGAPGLVGN